MRWNPWQAAPALFLLAAACGGGGFADNFAFGAAVAGFQVEMGCPTVPAEVCEDRNSDWYAFVTSTVAQSRSGNFLAGDPPSRGPGYYELYEADLDRLASVGLTHFRFSVEWSRVFPNSTVGIEGQDALRAVASAEGLDWYRRQLAAMKTRGITPLVTLNHYTLPSWLHDAVGCNGNLEQCSRRGWLEPYAVEEIAKYAGFVAAELGSEVDWWATENEPLAVVLPGYIQPSETRTNPPSVSLKLDEARTVMLRLIEAHARMTDAVRAADRVDADGDGEATQIGLVYAVVPVHPKNPESQLDLRAARNVDKLYNHIFLDAVVNGVLDEDLDGVGSPVSELAGRSDWLGVNYYTRVVVEGETDSLFPDFSPLATFNPLTLEQGAVYPEGMFEVLMSLTERYPNTPLIVSENGVDAAAFSDVSAFLVQHVGQVQRALEAGADVRGYYYWSLIDNYEWNHGMRQKFGLWAVDPDDVGKARTPRASVDLYRQIIQAREVTSALLGAHPIAAVN